MGSVISPKHKEINKAMTSTKAVLSNFASASSAPNGGLDCYHGVHHTDMDTGYREKARLKKRSKATSVQARVFTEVGVSESATSNAVSPPITWEPSETL